MGVLLGCLQVWREDILLRILSCIIPWITCSALHLATSLLPCFLLISYFIVALLFRFLGLSFVFCWLRLPPHFFAFLGSTYSFLSCWNQSLWVFFVDIAVVLVMLGVSVLSKLLSCSFLLLFFFWLTVCLFLTFSFFSSKAELGHSFLVMFVVSLLCSNIHVVVSLPCCLLDFDNLLHVADAHLFHHGSQRSLHHFFF